MMFAIASLAAPVNAAVNNIRRIQLSGIKPRLEFENKLHAYRDTREDGPLQCWMITARHSPGMLPNSCTETGAYFNVQLVTISAVKWQLCSCSCKFGTARVEKRGENR